MVNKTSPGGRGGKKIKKRYQYFFKKGVFKGEAYCCQEGGPHKFFLRAYARKFCPPLSKSPRTLLSSNEKSSNEIKNSSNEQYIYSIELLFISTTHVGPRAVVKWTIVLFELLFISTTHVVPRAIVKMNNSSNGSSSNEIASGVKETLSILKSFNFNTLDALTM